MRNATTFIIMRWRGEVKSTATHPSLAYPTRQELGHVRTVLNKRSVRCYKKIYKYLLVFLLETKVTIYKMYYMTITLQFILLSYYTVFSR